MQSCDGDRKYFFLAVNTGFVDHGNVDGRCLDFYRARSGNGLHCSIVGNVVTPGGFASNDVCGVISADPSWRELAGAISAEGALPGIQLSSAWAGYRGMRRFVPRGGEYGFESYREMARSISAADARQALDGLRRGTDLALAAGFRHIQLHAAHGYLFNLLVDPRLSLHFDLAASAIERWASDLASVCIESSIRISLWSGASELDNRDAGAFTSAICGFPVDYIDASVGFYNVDKRLIYPSSVQHIADRVDATLALAERHPNTRVILSGKSARAWDVSLPANVHIGICRDLIANPNFLRDRDNGCSHCMKCHYHSRGQPDLSCGRWAARED